MKRTAVFIAAALAVGCFMSSGCSSKVSIEEGRAKIEELAGRGVPEREMSDLKMYLFQMETAQRTGNSSVFRTYQDSLTVALASFEEKMTAILEQSGPYMDSLRLACDGKIAQLKGLHLEAGDKGKAAVDSLMKIESQKLYARSRLEAWSLELDTLIMRQAKADSLRDQFVGIWVTESESTDPSFKVVERNEIHMRPDGSLLVREGRIGRQGGKVVEDWLFESTGTWDLLGDVAHHYITREKRVRQVIQGNSQPPYDSTVAKGTKDRYAAWEGLNKDYKRFPIKR